jgi:CBS domain-containing protein
MTVQDILDAKGNQVFAVDPESTLHAAVSLMVDQNVGSLLVVDRDGALAGIITERDVLRESKDRFEQLRTTRVKEVMSRRLLTATPDEPIDDVQRTMLDHRIRHLPVLDQGRLVGLVSIGDVNKILLDAREVENHGLREYIGGYH